jgi:uncharacterized protein (TIGR02452 family)
MKKQGKKGKEEKIEEKINTKKRHCHPIAKKLTEPTSPHFTKSWLTKFNKASSTKDSKELKNLRKFILNQTFCAFTFEHFLLEDFTKIELDKEKFIFAPLKTVFYNEDFKYKNISNLKKKTQILIIEGDCVDAGIYLKNSMKLNPIILNMASDKNPGGGYRGGSGAQEENLHRRSNLYQCLEDPDSVNPESEWEYPLPLLSGVYSPNVCFIRGNEALGYPFLSEPEYLSVLSMAALRHPKLVKDLMINEKDANITKEKIRRMFKISLENGHDSMVLSAFGCGAFGNPPKHMAMLFKSVTEEFEGCFDCISFAIFNDHNSGKSHNKEGNLKPFEDVFNQKSKKFEELNKV